MTNGQRRRILKRLLLTKEADRVFRRLHAQAHERLELSGQDLERYPYNAFATTVDYWPTDGSWAPSPEAVALIGTERFQRSYRMLNDSLKQHPVTPTGDNDQQ